MAKDVDEKKLPKGICYRKDGRYMAQITYRGEKHTLYDRDLRELKRKFADLKYELRHGTYSKPDYIKVTSWFEKWIEVYKKPTVKQTTLALYIDIFNRYVKDTIGHMMLTEVRVMDIQKIYNDLYYNGYSYNTMELVSIVLSGMFNEALNNDIIIKNVVTKAEIPKVSKKKPRVLSRDRQKIFMEAIKTSFLKCLFFLALATGMRSGELRGLEWKDVDFEKKVIRVRKTLLYINNDYTLGDPKTESSIRDIPLVDNAIEILNEQQRRQEEERKFMGKRWKPKKGMEDLVFTTATGYPINRDVLKCEMNRVIESINKNGIKFDHITPHTLRHTMATRCMEKGMSLKVLQSILGHSKSSTTMDLYVHSLSENEAKEMHEFDPTDF